MFVYFLVNSPSRLDQCGQVVTLFFLSFKANAGPAVLKRGKGAASSNNFRLASSLSTTRRPALSNASLSPASVQSSCLCRVPHSLKVINISTGLFTSGLWERMANRAWHCYTRYYNSVHLDLQNTIRITSVNIPRCRRDFSAGSCCCSPWDRFHLRQVRKNNLKREESDSSYRNSSHIYFLLKGITSLYKKKGWGTQFDGSRQVGKRANIIEKGGHVR